MATRATVPTITGNLFVANKDGTAIAEDKLTNVYGYYWPNLTIKAEKVSESYIGKYVQILDSGKEEEIDIKRFAPDDYEGQSPDLTSKIPNRTNYTFLGWALDAAGTKMVYNYDLYTQTIQQADYFTSDEFKFSETNSIITLYAIFELQKFGIKFYDGDGSLLVEGDEPLYLITGLNEREQVTKLVAYGETLPALKVLPYKDDSELELTEIYTLRGWSTSPNGDLSNITNKRVTSNLTYYPIFEIGDVYDNVLPEYFLKQITMYNGGPLVGLADGYSVRGKITLPAKFNGQQITGIGMNGFANSMNLRMVFWQKGATPTNIQDNAFSYTGLRYFEFLDTIELIGGSVFFEVGRNGKGGLTNRQLDVMTGLKTIGPNAFNHAFGPTDSGVVYLPASVYGIGQNAFRYNGQPIHGITGFVFGAVGQPSQLGTQGGTLGFNAFTSAGSAEYNITVYTDEPSRTIWDDLASQVGGAINKVDA